MVYIPQPHSCFLCTYGNTHYDGQSDMGNAYLRLRDMITSLYGYMPLRGLSVALANYYYVHMHQRHGTPYMDADDMREHLEH